MTAPRGLSADEAAAWARLAASVVPIHPPRHGEGDRPEPKAQGGGGDSPPATQLAASNPAANPLRRSPLTRRPPPPRSGEDRSALDSHWERRLRAGALTPDFTLDLHDHSLDAAHTRLLGGLDLAREAGARVVLVIAGRERPAPAADRGGARGAIRAKLLDWLAASRHAPAVATIRKAHRRHGGEGALYIVLRRAR